MATKKMIIKEIERLPEPLIDEILDYIRFLKKKKAGHVRETALASEYSLGRDWLRPEEDEAWRDLSFD
ncbi:MAG: DUF2281 domain-containing protein [Euryarchaeota archaeon]|nr:DUF2281 domain-containing protein [Euryarchaeota archaeon]